MISHIQSPDIVRTVYSSIYKDVQGYSGIVMHIKPPLQMRNFWGWGGRPPLLFLKIEKNALVWEKNGPDCVQLRIKFCIQDVVLRLSIWKNFKMFLCRVFFSCFFYAPALKYFLFVKCSILNVGQCSK